MFYEVDFRNYGSTTRSCVVRIKRNTKSEKKNKVDFVARQLSIERAAMSGNNGKGCKLRKFTCLLNSS